MADLADSKQTSRGDQRGEKGKAGRCIEGGVQSEVYRFERSVALYERKDRDQQAA